LIIFANLPLHSDFCAIKKLTLIMLYKMAENQSITLLLLVEIAKTDFSVNFYDSLKSILTIESRVPGLLFDHF
jgi:hypothetical protein